MHVRVVMSATVFRAGKKLAGIGAGVVATLSLATLPVAAELISGTSRDVSGWKIGAYTYNDTGKFSHCAMTAKFRSGITMVFAISHNLTWRAIWAHPDWKLTRGEKVEVTFSVDGGAGRQTMATARTTNSVTAELPDSADLFDSLRKGNQLTVYAQGNRYDFVLDGTHAALTETIACARNGGQPAAAASTPSPPAAPPRKETTPAGAEQRLEATTLVANLLAESDMSGHRILTGKERERPELRKFADWATMWQAGPVGGVLKIVPDGKPGEIGAKIIAEESRVCDAGTFTSGSTPDETNPKVSRLNATCTTGKDSYEVRYIVVPREAGGLYLFGTFGPADAGTAASPALTADSRLRSAIGKVLRQ